MVVNQIDLARKRGLNIDSKKLAKFIGNKILETNAKANIGIEEIKSSIRNNEFSVSIRPFFDIPSENLGLVFKISRQINEKNFYKVWTLIAADTYLGK
jgi:ferrous iron transport protein B